MAAAWRRGFARLASVACGKKPVLPASDRAEQLYAQIVAYAGGRRPLSPAEWASFEHQHGPASRSPFRNQLVECLVAKRDRAIAQSLLEYVESAGGGVTRTFLAHYLALCSTEQEAAACLRRILESSGGLLDARTRDLVVRALCQTPLWKRATDLLDQPQPSSDAFNAVAVAAFTYADCDTAWHCLERLRSTPPLRVFPATLEACLAAAAALAQKDQPDKGRRLVDRLLAHLADSQGPVPSALARNLAGFYDKWAPAGWTSGSARISRDGHCSRCGCQLDSDRLSASEWEQLRRGVLERCLQGDDPYLGSNPEELAHFREFLAQAPPYDVVLDGLNVALKSGPNPADSARQLLRAVRHYAVKQGRSVLLVGRKHMLQWPAEVMDRVWQHCLRYLTNNTSHDDPFVLYAALHGGPGTLLVSRDLMRQHLFRLGDAHLQELFGRWRHLHQEQFGNATPTVSHRVQGSSACGWHVPHAEGNGTATAVSSAVQWLCLSPGKAVRSCQPQEINRSG